MKKLVSVGILLLLLSGFAFAQQDVTGFWKTIDDETGNPKSVLALYTHQGKLYGRVLITFEDDGVRIKDDIHRGEHRSPFLVGDPSFAGLDVIWDLTWDQRRGQWRGGSIMDPGDKEKKPRIYGSEIWREGNELTVRGKIAFIGRNQTWLRFDRSDFPAGFAIPDYTSFRPSIPKVK